MASHGLVFLDSPARGSSQELHLDVEVKNGQEGKSKPSDAGSSIYGRLDMIF